MAAESAADQGGVSAVQPAPSRPVKVGEKHAAPYAEALFGLLVMAGLLFINRGFGFLLVIFVLPVMGEWLLLKGSGRSGMGAAMALIPMGLLLMPGVQGIVFAAYGILASWLLSPWPPTKSIAVRSLIWGALTTGVLLFLVAQAYTAYLTADPAYAGGLVDYLADWMTAAVAQSPQGNAMLISAYQAGYARYGGAGETLPAFQLGGVVVLSNEVREQLLLSFRYTLGETMRQSVPMTLLLSGGMVALVTALAAGRTRRKHQLPVDVPLFEQWHLPRGWGLGIGALAAGYLFQGDGTLPLILYLSVLMVGVFRFVYTIQGIATVHFLTARMGIRWIGTALITALGLWLMPELFQFIGLFDQISPMRQLRKKQQEG